MLKRVTDAEDLRGLGKGKVCGPMRKIPSVFQRAWDGDRQAMRAVTAGTEWVLAGEGVATRKWDGTCCLVRGGKLFKRYEVKAHGRPPENFEPATDADPVTGKQQGG